VLRDHESIGGEVKASITFVMFGIPKKDATSGAWSKFVRCYGGHVRVAFAAKDTNMLISGSCTKQGIMRAWCADGLGGEMIQQVRRCVETLNPIASW
jgi:hypothetical protein